MDQISCFNDRTLKIPYQKVFPRLCSTPQQTLLPCVVPCHSEATVRRVSLAWVSDICSLDTCTFSYLSCTLWQHLQPQWYNRINKTTWDKFLKPYFLIHANSCLMILWNTFHLHWCRLTGCSKICTHGRMRCLSWQKYGKIFFPFDLFYAVLPYTAFIQSSSFSTLVSKVTIFQFLTVLVTLVSVILLSSMTAVIASPRNQVGKKDLRFLEKINSLLRHLVIDEMKVFSTFFLNKTAGGPSSVVAVE